MRVRIAFIAVAMIALAAASADAGVIRGMLWMNNPPRTAKARAAAQRKHPARSQRGVNQAVVYIEQVPDGVEDRLANPTTPMWLFHKRPAPRTPRIIERNRQFNPRVVAVPAGMHVEFQNLDRIYHSAFSVSGANRFKLGANPPGRVDSVQFDRAGVINLFCDIHSDEFGYVIVTPNHVMVRPDAFGAFRLPKLPPGSYTLRVWHPTRGELKREVEVPKHGNLWVDLRY